MIITGLHNSIKLNMNKTATKPNTLPTSFTSKLELNRDVFVLHDDNNTTQQYLNTYEPAAKQTARHVDFRDYENIIEVLNSNNILDLTWVQKHSDVLKSILGLDVYTNPETRNLFLSELNLNRDKVCETVIKNLEKEIERFYNFEFSNGFEALNYKVENFDDEALKKYNFATTKMDNVKKMSFFLRMMTKSMTEEIDIPTFYRTNKPIDINKLKKHTKANIIDLRQEIKNNNRPFRDIISSKISKADEHYYSTDQRNIIIVNDMYKHLHNDYTAREAIHSAAINLKDTHSAIIITEDILPRVETKNRANNLEFSEIPAYKADKQRFINEIIEPLSRKTTTPQFIIFDSKTTPKDTYEFLHAGLNEINSDVNVINPTTNINDFENIITNIKNRAEYQPGGTTTFIIIPQAYKYIAGRPQNIELLKSLNSTGNKIIPILYSSYNEKILEKMQLDNNYKQFTLNKLSENELEQLLRLYTDKADDYINDKITSGKNIEPINIDNINYNELAKMLKDTQYCGFKNIKELIDKAVNSYLLSQKHTFNNYLFKYIAGGLNNEN